MLEPKPVLPALISSEADFFTSKQGGKSTEIQKLLLEEIFSTHRMNENIVTISSL